MPVSCRHIAGVSLERLAALADGIFAVAMTLLVLGLSVRASNALHPARPLWAPGALTSEHVVWDVLDPRCGPVVHGLPSSLSRYDRPPDKVDVFRRWTESGCQP